MTINQLQYFMSLATRLNFRAVAERYFITQPTLSRQIAALEDELGVKLFERNKHGVELTEAGRTLESKLPDIYQQLTGLLMETQETAAMGSKHLSIVVQDDQIISPVLMEAINHFREKEPDVHIRLDKVSINDLYNGLLEEKFDIANVIDLDGQYMREMEFHVFGEDRCCIAMRSDYAENFEDSLTSEDVDRLVQMVPMHLVSMEYYDSVSEPIQSVRNNLHVELPEENVRLESKFESLPLRVSAGLCTTVVNETHVMQYDPSIQLVPVEGAKGYQKGVLYQPDNSNPTFQRFLNDLI